MSIYSDSFAAAFGLLATVNSDLIEILHLSMKVSLLSLALSCLIGLPIGATLAIRQFHGRCSCQHFQRNDGTAAGCCWLIGLSAPIAVWPIWLAGVALHTTSHGNRTNDTDHPIIIALSCQVLEDLHEDYKDFLRVL